MEEMKSILHLTSTYLETTNTFVYDQIKYTFKYKPLVLTNKIENLENYPETESFPHKSIFKFPYILVKDRFYYLDNKPKQYTLNFLKNLLDWIYRPFINRYFRKFKKEHNIALLHSHFGTNAIGFLKLKRALNVPMLTFFYGHDVSILEKTPRFYKKLFREGEFFITESKFLADKLLNMGCPKNKLRVQRQGIDLEDFKFKPRELKKGEKIKILVVGRFVEKKGIEYAIKAFAKSLRKYKNLELRIMGDGPLRNEIISLIERLNIKDNVILLGMQPYSILIKEMDSCHIFMLPSVTARDGDTEGQGTVFLEAQAVGMPVLSTLHNGIPDGVLDGKSGFLVKERDSDALSERLDYLIENPNIWPKMGKAGRKFMEENFEIKNQIKILEELYTKLIE